MRFTVSGIPDGCSADRNGDCVYQEGEPLLSGVTIQLINAQGQVIATTLTDAMGHYQFLDLAPKGRDEAGLPFPMTWVKLHDQYPQ